MGWGVGGGCAGGIVVKIDTQLFCGCGGGVWGWCGLGVWVPSSQCSHGAAWSSGPSTLLQCGVCVLLLAPARSPAPLEDFRRQNIDVLQSLQRETERAKTQLINPHPKKQ